MSRDEIKKIIIDYYDKTDISELTISSIIDVVREQNLSTKEEIVNLLKEADEIIKEVSHNTKIPKEERLGRAKEFCMKVRELADIYNLPFFVVTDGASATKNSNCEAVKHARDCHKKWELEHNFDPNEDWNESINE